MPTFEQVVEFLMTPSWAVIILGLAIVLGAPVLLHVILSRSVTYIVPPSVLLLGPRNAGKTALQTLYERGGRPAPSAATTHTSQSSQSVELNASTDAARKTTYRNHDESDGTYTKFLLVDTPGHGKLRGSAMGRLRRAEKLRAVDGWLGEYGSDKFEFGQMQEFDIEVDVVPGSVMAEEPDADKWWWWIAQRV
ncbi:hypothetical protein LLEC1_06964 [Akanthomyces lecanii]|uniref:Signal recognition particle receptor subunit beta n=1 Tax=Cordyceps confragosa TaxID=2714763 RepID=A0A179I1P1_CORDF|nr:hypothetical protein LLEC1_06964 [Akanthomyces lecanii]